MFSVNPENLQTTKTKMWVLRDEVSDTGRVPPLSAGRAASGIPGSAIAGALADADDANSQAKQVIAGRLHTLGQLLDASATFYDGTDTAVAARIATLTDLNEEPAR